MDRRTTIVKILQTAAKKNVQPATDESLFDSGLLDSFALADVVSAIEKEFSIQIPDADLNPRKFDTIERIEQYLDSRS